MNQQAAFTEWQRMNSACANPRSFKRAKSRSPMKQTYGRIHSSDDQRPRNRSNSPRETNFFKRRVPNEYYLSGVEKDPNKGGNFPPHIPGFEGQQEKKLECRKQGEFKEKQEGNAVKNEDLRILLEKSKTSQQGSMPTLLKSAENEASSQQEAPSGDISETSYIPVISNSITSQHTDYSSEPSVGRLLGNYGSKVTSSEAHDRLLQNFKHDCDTVAQVAQMLINEDPALEKSITNAVNKVLQKLVKTHLAVFKK